LAFKGGENWIANRGRYTYIYTIDSEKEVKEITLMDISELAEVRYDGILQYIPGTQIGSKAGKFGDFNGDGIDEIFYISLYFTGGFDCTVMGYDNEEGKIVFYINSPLNMASPSACPVGFYNYQGTDGLMIHMWSHSSRCYLWFFGVWDKEKQKYTEFARIWENDKDYSSILFSQDIEKQDNQTGNGLEGGEARVTRTEEPPTEAVIIGEQPEETVLPAVEDGVKSLQFSLIILIAGTVAVAVVVIFLVARKKRK
jgi:hypothetical protein